MEIIKIRPIRSVIAILSTILCCLFGAGCQVIPITSQPAGAKILIDGKDTKRITPFVYSPRHFRTGHYKISVEKAGYSTVTPPQDLKVIVSRRNVVFSIIPPFCVPFFFKNLLGTHWKMALPKTLETFQLDDGARQPAPACNMHTSTSSADSSSLNYAVSDFRIVEYDFDAQTGRGTITVDMEGKGFNARLWVIKNIGIICSSKNVALDAGSETFNGAKYSILNESIRDGLLKVDFQTVY